eukprot:765549-Hanusia_phi.AAC.4
MSMMRKECRCSLTEHIRRETKSMRFPSTVLSVLDECHVWKVWSSYGKLDDEQLALMFGFTCAGEEDGGERGGINVEFSGVVEMFPEQHRSQIAQRLQAANLNEKNILKLDPKTIKVRKIVVMPQFFFVAPSPWPIPLFLLLSFSFSNPQSSLHRA